MAKTINLDLQRRSQAAYDKHRLRHAANGMPVRFGQAFMDAFNACGVEDVYGGEPWRYMQVIAQVLRQRNEEINDLKRKIRAAAVLTRDTEDKLTSCL